VSKQKQVAKGAARARAVAAEKIAAQRAKERRRRALIVSGIVVGVIAIAAVIGVFVFTGQQEEAARSELPKGADRTGVIVGETSAPAAIDIYLDFQCPACKNLEAEIGDQVSKWVADGTAKVNYHPVAFLDKASSGKRYSSRSSAASGCAADAGVLPAYVAVLYENQPPEGATGLTDDELVDLGEEAGAQSGTFADCVRDEHYEGWTKTVTDDASKREILRTPTVFVNAQQLPNPSLATLTQAVEQAGA
jgi:protein-disulfide isomerase